jgi:phasin
MAEPTMSAENVRVMLAENLERLRKASADYFEMLEKNLGSAQLPVGGGHAKQYFELMQRNVTATFDLCDKLIKAKDVQDSMKIQSEFFQEQMRAMTDQARSLGESTMKAMTGAFVPKS